MKKISKFLNITGIRFFNFFIILLQFISGMAAVVISISTTVFVLSELFPNTFVPIVAGLSLDLAKVSSIFMANFTKNKNNVTRLLSVFWRLMLVTIAALFTAITISGVMFNMNIDEMAESQKKLIGNQYENTLEMENEDYNRKYSIIESQKAEERKTGIGVRYEQLVKEQEEMTLVHNERMKELTIEYNENLKRISKDTFEGDRNKNIVLYENFKDAINLAFNLETSYTFWIFLQVVLIALILELTTYVVFDGLATSVSTYVFQLQDFKKKSLESYFQIRSNELEFATEVDSIQKDSKLQKIENSANANVLEEKFSDDVLKAEKVINSELEEVESNINKGLLDNITDILSDIKNNHASKKSSRV